MSMEWRNHIGRICALVKAEEASEWVEYSVAKPGWIEDSARLRAIHLVTETHSTAPLTTRTQHVRS
jgi:hypothetical protein